MRPAVAAGRSEIAVAALLWWVFVVGLAVGALTVPVYTSALTQALGVPGSAGLSAADVVKLTGQVRALVADAEYAPLPSEWRGRPAFDEGAVSHLEDVRAVMSGARIATGVAALLLALHVGWCVARRRLRVLRCGMMWGAGSVAVFIALAALAGLFDFGSLFAAFHGLFFAEGTWTFPYDSLLIRLFPERFWSVSAGAVGALSLVGAGLLALAARLLRATASREYASRTPNNV